METNVGSNFKEDLCVICSDSRGNEKLVRVRAGLETLMSSSKSRKNEQLFQYLSKQRLSENPCKVFVHENCRKDYIRPVGENIEKSKEKQVVRTRLSASFFDWKNHCFYCGLKASFDMKHPQRNKVFQATLVHTRDKILEACKQKLLTEEDEWVEQVQSRLLSCIDLVQAEAR